eukprot:symbB.v1.2.034830.t1/scaffold4569.1/size37850/2
MLQRQGPGGRRQRKTSKEKFVAQLYVGCTKKLTVKRKVVDTSESVRECEQCNGKGGVSLDPLLGFPVTTGACSRCHGTGKNWKVGHVSEELEVYVPMGSANGETILFRGKADEEPGCETGNLLVVLHEEEHPRFQRRGADLYMKMEISLAEALIGFKRILQHLDERRVLVRSTNALPLGPRWPVKAVKGQGMPFKGQPFNFGNLFLLLKVNFPTAGLKNAQLLRVVQDLQKSDVLLEPKEAEACELVEHELVPERCSSSRVW